MEKEQSTWSTVMSLPTEIDNLLSDLETITPSQLASVLQEDRPHLERDDWSAILYTIEELATTGQADRASDLMSVCVRHAHLAQNTWLIQATTYFLGHVHRHRGEVEQAIVSYQMVAEAGLAAGDKDGQEEASLALGSISFTRMSQGRIPEAIAAREEALILDEQLGWHKAAILDRLNLARLYLAQENFDRAEAMMLETFDQAQALDDALLTAMTWSSLAEIQTELYDQEAALESYQTALDVLEAVEDPADVELWLQAQQSALTGLGTVRQEMGQLDESITYYAEAARTAYALGDTRSQAAVITWLGTAQLDAEHPEQALRSFKAAARLSSSVGDKGTTATAYFYQASALQALGSFDEAEQTVCLAMQILAAIPGEFKVDKAGCLIKLGEIALERGQIEKAITHYQQASAVLQKADVGMADRLVYARLGEAFWRLGDLPHAYDTLRKALSVYESKRRTVSSLMARIDFAPSREKIYANLARTCLTLRKSVEALEVIEEGRARVFRERLAQREITLDLGKVLGWQELRSLL